MSSSPNLRPASKKTLRSDAHYASQNASDDSHDPPLKVLAGAELEQIDEELPETLDQQQQYQYPHMLAQASSLDNDWE
jgi:hypothetical protein